MHELSIAEAVVAIAEKHAAERRVTKVEVKIGQLRQVVPSALTFAFELVAQGTPVAGAELEIEDVPVRIACRACAAESVVADLPLVCEDCGGFDVDVRSGDELLVDAVELEESIAEKM